MPRLFLAPKNFSGSPSPTLFLNYMSARDLEQFDKPLKLRCPWILEPSLAGLSIYGPKADGTHIVEFKTATGDTSLRLSLERTPALPQCKDEAAN